MFQIPHYKKRVSLIPGGCPQLMDFETNLATLPRMRRCFAETPGRTDTSKMSLHSLKEEDGQFFDDVTGDPINAERYEIDGRKALAPWLGKWIPVPFLREREQLWERDGECRVEQGPSNWARVYMVEDTSRPETLRIVLAFDMQVEEPAPEVGRYAALAPGDINAHAQFRLAPHVRDNAWFLNEPWIDQWLKDTWDEYLRANRKRRPEDAPTLEYLAYYLSMLDVLKFCIQDVKVYVINPERHTPVDVDLVLDIGNSRTTGMLVETRAQSVTNLNDSYLLQLRDMDRPENVYTDPFETSVEFSEIDFGNDALSRRSGRLTVAFSWPSPVRIGPEAARLSTLSVCAEGATGMSSPKRYLWDERDWQQSWRFNTRGASEPFVTRGLLAHNVNSSGTPLCCMDDSLFTRNKILRKQEREAAFESLFTRSSLMMFLLVEVIQQALLTINSPGQRGRRDVSDLPRRLRQIIFTVPAGMPIAEQRIYRRWAKWAVHVLWESLGWEHFYSQAQNRKQPRADYRTSPIVRCDWDEATCTQLVYVYNEITRKYQGDAHLLCRLVGRRRPEYGNRPCVRVASIDIGGGTTDLSITTFDLQSDEGSTARMAPHPEFRDGFNIAGDDVLAAVVRDHILPAIGEAMVHAGIPDSKSALAHLFGHDVMDRTAESRNARIQFVRQAAVPVALGLLTLYEQAGQRANGVATHAFRDFFRLPLQEESLSADPLPESLRHTRPSDKALDYVASYVHAQTGTEFSLLDVPIKIDYRRLDDTIRGTLREAISNLCEVVHLYDCDALLLTGRPSCWHGVVDAVFADLPVPPDRIIPMIEYRMGEWYPFSDALGHMTDPKTTVVVGAILCTLAEGQLEGFSFDPSTLRLRSTARYIGEMELNGQIKRPKIWFEVDVNDAQEREYEHKISFAAPIAIGFRQIDAERWTTTRFYFLEFVNDEARRFYASRLPFSLTIQLVVSELTEDSTDGLESTSRDEGEFFIKEAEDRDGNPITVSNILDIRLQTLPRNEGFWLDTGVVV